MSIYIQYFPKEHPPLIRMSIHDAPHRRMQRSIIQKYREDIVAAAKAANIPIPLDNPVDLSILFVNPTSKDLGNSYLALEQAIDGKALKGPALLVDDGLVSSVTMSKYYPQGDKK